jgi:hypothetical protein
MTVLGRVSEIPPAKRYPAMQLVQYLLRRDLAIKMEDMCKFILSTALLGKWKGVGSGVKSAKIILGCFQNVEY